MDFEKREQLNIDLVALCKKYGLSMRSMYPVNTKEEIIWLGSKQDLVDFDGAFHLDEKVWSFPVH